MCYFWPAAPQALKKSLKKLDTDKPRPPPEGGAGAIAGAAAGQAGAEVAVGSGSAALTPPGRPVEDEEEEDSAAIALYPPGQVLWLRALPPTTGDEETMHYDLHKVRG